MSKTLSGKTAFVTGGSRGIGAAIVHRLAKEGARVAFTYAASADKATALAEEIGATGGAALPIEADSGHPDALQAAIRRAAERFGGIDILVNNAGILIRGMVDDYALSDFDRMLAVNIRGVFVAVQAALPHMSRGGRIITTGSVAADRAGFAGASVYSMTKAALAALTRGLARDLGPRGITVNIVEPGPTETDMNIREYHDMLKPLMAVGRMGKDTEIASLVAYLAGPETDFITGAALTIDGGYLA
ncbi:MAG TPA: 3-oxoacyl-ACP reductase family protein [Dongiaceae bacterium]|nr:3-oxoacyl-ACP reductase family protein [Dongiaceae bacterium]